MLPVPRLKVGTRVSFTATQQALRSTLGLDLNELLMWVCHCYCGGMAIEVQCISCAGIKSLRSAHGAVACLPMTDQPDVDCLAQQVHVHLQV